VKSHILAYLLYINAAFASLAADTTVVVNDSGQVVAPESGNLTVGKLSVGGPVTLTNAGNVFAGTFLGLQFSPNNTPIAMLSQTAINGTNYVVDYKTNLLSVYYVSLTNDACFAYTTNAARNAYQKAVFNLLAGNSSRNITFNNNFVLSAPLGATWTNYSLTLNSNTFAAVAFENYGQGDADCMVTVSFGSLPTSTSPPSPHTPPPSPCNTLDYSTSATGYVMDELGIFSGYRVWASWFVAPENMTACAAGAYLKQLPSTSATFTITANIWSDNSGVPGSPIGSTSGGVSSSGLPLGATEVIFHNINAPLSSGVKYWLVVFVSGPAVGYPNGLAWTGDQQSHDSGTYTYGILRNTADDGSGSWADMSIGGLIRGALTLYK
jgi:hypothetical protein